MKNGEKKFLPSAANAPKLVGCRECMASFLLDICAICHVGSLLLRSIVQHLLGSIKHTPTDGASPLTPQLIFAEEDILDVVFGLLIQADHREIAANSAMNALHVAARVCHTWLRVARRTVGQQKLLHLRHSCPAALVSRKKQLRSVRLDQPTAVATTTTGELCILSTRYEQLSERHSPHCPITCARVAMAPPSDVQVLPFQGETEQETMEDLLSMCCDSAHSPLPSLPHFRYIFSYEFGHFDAEAAVTNSSETSLYHPRCICTSAEHVYVLIMTNDFLRASLMILSSDPSESGRGITVPFAGLLKHAHHERRLMPVVPLTMVVTRGCLFVLQRFVSPESLYTDSVGIVAFGLDGACVGEGGGLEWPLYQLFYLSPKGNGHKFPPVGIPAHMAVGSAGELVAIDNINGLTFWDAGVSHCRRLASYTLPEACRHDMVRGMAFAEGRLILLQAVLTSGAGACDHSSGRASVGSADDTIPVGVVRVLSVPRTPGEWPEVLQTFKLPPCSVANVFTETGPILLPEPFHVWLPVSIAASGKHIYIADAGCYSESEFDDNDSEGSGAPAMFAVNVSGTIHMLDLG